MMRTTNSSFVNMSLKIVKYLWCLSLPLLIIISFQIGGYFTFLPVVYIFFIIPLLEIFLPPDSSNHSLEDESYLLNHHFFDYLLYFMVVLQYLFIILFCWVLMNFSLSLTEKIGLTLSMGLMCGVFGINVGHELGHRKKKHERFLAKVALLSSLYLHFYIEHNRGHHKHVSTDQDPASARKNEVVYLFWLRSITFGYLSAWTLEQNRLRKRNIPIISWQNEMLRFQLIQLIWIFLIAWFFGVEVLLYYVAAAGIGILLLETVNYIEHYGLHRKKLSHGYERVLPHHSWNSNHIIGRLILFELSRHSDHHYIASRKYQILRHHEHSPQMPTGYPGMMLLALVPPLWFYVMHREIDRLLA